MSSASSFVQTIPLQKIIDQYQNQADKSFEQNDILRTYVRELRNKLSQLEGFALETTTEETIPQANQQELSSLREIQKEIRGSQSVVSQGSPADVQVSSLEDIPKIGPKIPSGLKHQEKIDLKSSEYNVVSGAEFLVSFWMDQLQQVQADYPDIQSNKVAIYEHQSQDYNKRKGLMKHAGLLHISLEASKLLQKLNEVSSSQDIQNNIKFSISKFLGELDPMKERILKDLIDIDEQEIARFEEQNKKLGDYQATIEDLRQQLEDSQEEVRSYQGKIQQALLNQQQLNDKDTHIQSLNIKVKELEQKFTQVTAHASNNHDEYMRSSNRSDQLEHSVQEDLKDLQHHKQAGNRFGDDGGSTPDLEVEVHFLKAENQRLTIELEELGQQFVDNSKAHSRAHNQLHEIKRESEQKSRQIEKLRQQLIEQKDNTKDVQNMFKDMSGEIAELSSRIMKKDTQIEQLESSLGDAEQISKDLEQQLQAMELEGANNEEIIGLYDLNRCLQQQMQDLKRAYKEKQAQVEILEAQNQDMEDKNQYLSESNNKLKEKVQDLSNASQRLLKLVERKNTPVTRGSTQGTSSNRGTPSKQAFRAPTPKSPRSSRNSIE